MSSESQRRAALKYYHTHKDKQLERQRMWRQQNPDYQKQYMEKPENRELSNSRKRHRRNEVQAVVRLRKLTLGCSECGYNAHHAALEWHHPNDDKGVDVAFCLSVTAAEREMTKCIVLCSNCHKIHHWDEREAKEHHVLIADVYNPILDS